MKTISKGKWVFDSNLLIYALDQTSLYFTKTSDLFLLIQNHTIEPIVSTQNIAEVVNVFVEYYKYPQEEVAKRVEGLLANFEVRVITPLPTTPDVFFSLLRRLKPTRAIHDLFLAATLIDNNETRLLTANPKDFAGIPELTILNPLTL